MQNVLGIAGTRLAFNFTVNTNNPTAATLKCSNTALNLTAGQSFLSNVACVR